MGIGGWVGRRGLVGAAGWSDTRLDMWAAVSIGGGASFIGCGGVTCSGNWGVGREAGACWCCWVV